GSPDMTRKVTLSPEAQALFDTMTNAGIEIPTPNNILQYRQDMINGSAADIEQEVARFEGDIEDLEIASVKCRQITPVNWDPDQGPCIQYAYGGGYVSGSVQEDQIITLPLAAMASTRIVMVDYRLSPEHPYPAPEQDMQTVYRELIDFYGTQRLIVSGESAGGHQALSVMQYACNQGLALPACAVLFSPWVDLTNQGDSHQFNDQRDPTLNNAWVDSAAAMHAAGVDLADPGISPINADVAGLPPCLITTGSCDLLLSQCLRLADKLQSANVSCDLRVWEGMWHVFEFYTIPEARQSLQQVADFIRRHI
ncbi:MAG: alpha/beta hydrolase, partial [Pseudomonadota bacterium]